MYYTMRRIMNISLPEEMARDIKKQVVVGHFSSISEFVRTAVREYRINTVLRDARKAHHDYTKGKLLALNSLKDLR